MIRAKSKRGAGRAPTRPARGCAVRPRAWFPRRRRSWPGARDPTRPIPRCRRGSGSRRRRRQATRVACRATASRRRDHCPRRSERPAGAPLRTRRGAQARGTSPGSPEGRGLPFEDVHERARSPRSVCRSQLQARPAENEVRPGRDPYVGGIDFFPSFATSRPVGLDHVSGVQVWCRVGDPSVHSVLVQRHQRRIAQPEQGEFVTVSPDQEIDTGSRTVGDGHQWVLGQEHAIDQREKRQRDHPRIWPASADLLGCGHEF